MLLFSDVLWQEGLLTRLAGILLLVFIYKLFKSSRNNTTNASKDISSLYTVCNDSTCVRCHADISINKLALAKQLRSEDAENMQRIGKWANCTGLPGVEHKQQPTVFYLPDLSTFPLIDVKFHAHDVNLLEANYDVILRDYINLENDINEKSCWKKNITPQGSWSVFYLINQGSEVQENAKKCSSTMQILDELKDLLRNCAFGNACFSVVYPNTIITEHYGPCNVRTRCHLGLRIPSSCVLHVDDKSVTWEEGRCLLFDDSFLHSVTYSPQSETAAARVVFMVDLWHYNLSCREQKAIAKIFSSV